MSYAPTLTDQKFESILSIELTPRYVLGCIRYAPTLTDQKFESILSIESKTGYVQECMRYAPTLTDEGWGGRGEGASDSYRGNDNPTDGEWAITSVFSWLRAWDWPETSLFLRASLGLSLPGSTRRRRRR